MTRVDPATRDLAALPVNVLLVGQMVSLVQRRGRYTSLSMRHPGKMLPELARQLIEAYTIPGDWILDPMSGIGTTGVEAAHLGRNYVGIELEDRFVALQQENLALARQQGATGKATVLQGDARRLNDDTSPLFGKHSVQPIDAIITSPPYGDRLKPRTSPPSPMMRDLIRRGRMRADVIPAGYGVGSDNLGNLSDAAYLQEMRRVYAGCLAVLKPCGILAVVIRPGRDRQHLRPLHYETARLCTEIGFDWIDERIAVLGRIATSLDEPPRLFNHALFLKRLAIAHLREAGHPVSLEHAEYVLVFQKPTATPLSRSQRKNGRQAALAGSRPERLGWRAE
jgi:DNA modification methylase